MAELAVINSSPFIFLARGGHLDLLPNFYNNVMMPQQVADELLVRGSEDPAARAIEGSTWLHVTRVDTIPASIEAWGLGAGESAVLAWRPPRRAPMRSSTTWPGGNAVYPLTSTFGGRWDSYCWRRRMA